MVPSDVNLSLTYHDDLWRIIFWMCRVDLQHILKCIEIKCSRLVSVLNCIEMQYSRLLSILICWRWCSGYDLFEWDGSSAVAWVKMNVQQKRANAQRETKRKDNTLGRHCANKAPVRQQGATHKGSKTTSPFCVVLKTYHLDTWILHKTWLKHSNFLNRKTVCPIVSTWNIMATTMGQRTEEKQNKLRQSSKHGNYNIICITILYLLVWSSPILRLHARFSVSCQCWCSRQTCYLSVFCREILS